jgi:nucleobase:cation symporter-1, NCS1 family
VELRSIDYIPRAERHGKAWHVAPVWIAGNANFGSIALGFVGIGLGSNVLWTMLAIVAGSAFGTFFSALHATQGPHLGLPQLIQSRPQFGYAGALVVLLLALFTYIGFSVLTNIIAAQSLLHTVHLEPKVAYIGVSLLAGLLTFAGYDSIHVVFRAITLCFIATFALLTVVAPFKVGMSSDAFDPHGFALTPFLVQFSVVAGYQITWAIYVSDYTRYLPRDIDRRRTFWTTYLGMSLSAIWLPALGAMLALETAVVDPVGSVLRLGDSIAPGLGGVAVLMGLGGICGSLVMNMYGGSLTLLTIADSVRGFTPGVRHRALAVAAMVLGTIALTYPAASDFRDYLTTFLQVLLYLFAPWTAINLADFFLVRRGVFSINEIFNRNGIYGRVNVKGMSSYLAGLAAEVPFMAISLYVGPVAHAWNGVDIAPFVGLAVAGGAYLVAHRGFDLLAESLRTRQLDADLDQPPGAPTA